MQIIISLSGQDTELMPVAAKPDGLTDQAREAKQRAEKNRIEREYAGEDLTQKEINERERTKQEQAEQQKRDDPNRLPEEMPRNIGLSKPSEDDTAITITNRHDNLPGSAA